MKLKIALAAATMLVAPAFMSAQAQTSGVYVSGGYTQFDGEGGADLGGITGRVGVNFGPNFAVEGEGSFGVKGDSGTELDSEIGVFAVGKLPVNPSLDVFGRVGVSRIETSPFGDEDGLAYGAGAQWNLTAQDGIRGDWTRHDYDVGNVDAYSLSYVRSF
ncbi:MAG TPA: porin family protein [Hyphomonadaceae bacterium]|nr:porin family protein [Hyphomonadaceae bacterium]HPI48039.1 porin family protein [Hyphomonadaceae bacterium]